MESIAESKLRSNAAEINKKRFRCKSCVLNENTEPCGHKSNTMDDNDRYRLQKEVEQIEQGMECQLALVRCIAKKQEKMHDVQTIFQHRLVELEKLLQFIEDETKTIAKATKLMSDAVKREGW